LRANGERTGGTTRSETTAKQSVKPILAASHPANHYRKHTNRTERATPDLAFLKRALVDFFRLQREAFHVVKQLNPMFNVYRLQ
jgi:hypothetical protein